MKPESSSTPRQAWAENAADCLFAGDKLSSVEWSKQVSNLIGLPVLIVHRDELLSSADKIPQEELAGWDNWVRQRWEITSGPNIWDRDFLEMRAKIAGESGAILHGLPIASANTNGYFPFRLSGAYRARRAAIVVSDRSQQQDPWRGMVDSDLASFFERWPQSGALKHLVFLHELGHVLQHDDPAPLPVWIIECDADRFACEQMEARAKRLEQMKAEAESHEAAELRETVYAWKKRRALMQILGSHINHGTALATDSMDRGAAPLTMAESYAAGHELELLMMAKKLGRNGMARLGVADFLKTGNLYEDLRQMEQENFPQESNLRTALAIAESLRSRTIAEYMVNGTGPGVLLRGLQDTVQTYGTTMHPNTLRLGTLVFEAAQYFCPNLLATSAPDLGAALAAAGAAPENVRDGASPRFPSKELSM